MVAKSWGLPCLSLPTPLAQVSVDTHTHCEKTSLAVYYRTFWGWVWLLCCVLFCLVLFFNKGHFSNCSGLLIAPTLPRAIPRGRQGTALSCCQDDGVELGLGEGELQWSQDRGWSWDRKWSWDGGMELGIGDEATMGDGAGLEAGKLPLVMRLPKGRDEERWSQDGGFSTVGNLGGCSLPAA